MHITSHDAQPCNSLQCLFRGTVQVQSIIRCLTKLSFQCDGSICIAEKNCSWHQSLKCLTYVSVVEYISFPYCYWNMHQIKEIYYIKVVM